MNLNFENKVIVITGAASGIGEATAKLFLEKGASVALCDKDGERLKKVYGEVPAAKVFTMKADVSQESEVKAFVSAAHKKFGNFDVLVNDAGVYDKGDIADISFDDWRKILNTDLDGVFLMTREVIPYLVKTKGNIVNISSASGLGGDAGTPAYNAAKGAVTNLTRSLAIDYGPKGVRVNAICPTFTKTPLTADVQKDKAAVAKFIERIPMKRPGEAEDIARGVMLLASDFAGFITGVNLPVDGGVSASNGQPM